MSEQDIAAVRAVIDERLSAIRDRDAARANAMIDLEIVAFELIPPLALERGAARDEEATAAWLATFVGPIHVELRDLEVVASDRVAFAHGLHCLKGTRADGREVRLWMRSTFGLRKRRGKWLITHAHSSVPFRPDDGMRAALDLEP